MARSLRQTLALKAKLAREREAIEAQRPPRAEPAPIHGGLRLLTPPQRARADQVFAAARPYVERERPDYNDFDDIEIYEVLIDLAEDEDFLDAPTQTLVVRVLEALGCWRSAAALGEAEAPGEAPAVHDSA